LQISLADGSLFSPQSIWICNHPWPYWGNIYGDGFARPLNKPGDRFDLIIHGVKADGSEVTMSPITLAEYDPSEPYGVYEDPNWQQINLSAELKGEYQYLYFTMYSTDTIPVYGPNTAVYFCLDKLQVIKQEGTASPNPVAQKAKAKTATPSAKGIEVTDYFPITSYGGGEIVVFDAQGNETLKTTVKANEKPNLSKLPEGNYLLRHGHRHIPFKKVKY
jgi:hypothetical protein